MITTALTVPSNSKIYLELVHIFCRHLHSSNNVIIQDLSPPQQKYFSSLQIFPLNRQKPKMLEIFNLFLLLVFTVAGKTHNIT